MKYFITLSALLLMQSLAAQKINEGVQYHIQRARSEIKIDGVLDEQGWVPTETGHDFWMITPRDTSLTNAKTDFKLTYDDQYLYVGVVCHEAVKGKHYVVESLKRDFSFGKNDNLWLILEPFNDLTNGFVFGANPAGAQFDGMIFEGSNLNQNWDNKWLSATTYNSDYWVFEAAIPFKTLRYKAGETRWGLNFSRLDIKSNEKSSWAPIPREFKSITLAYTGNLIWDTPPPTPRSNISLIPYALAGTSKNYNPTESAQPRTDIGIDAKIAVTSSLNLDLTVNPDFSQVDVDQQVTNLDRFELFFPERRQFFLENSDLFSNFGTDNIRPFFSRRIGLGVPIQFGMRLSGKLDNNTRIGVLDMQTSPVKAEGRPVQNFGALVLQRKVFSRSNIGLLMINKQSIGFDSSEHHNFTHYNRNIGVEYNLASNSNRWTGKLMALKSFSPNKSGRDMAQTASITYTTRTWVNSLSILHAGSNYLAETGYVPRNGYYYVSHSIGYRLYPKGKNSTIFWHGPTVFSYGYWSESGNTTDNLWVGNYQVMFKNQAVLSAFTARDYVRLLTPFNPLNPYSGAYHLNIGSEHKWISAGSSFTSTQKRLFTYAFRTRTGGYYAGGYRFNLNGELGYRFQPFVALTVGADYNDIRHVAVYNSTTQVLENQNNRFWLFNSKIDITFTNKLFWTTYLQYNEQLNNINLNTRLQWRFKPASDLFLVYTDNYLSEINYRPEHFALKNRAIVLKATYWWGL